MRILNFKWLSCKVAKMSKKRELPKRLKLVTTVSDNCELRFNTSRPLCTNIIQINMPVIFCEQVNSLEISPTSMVAAAGFQHIRLYDLSSANPDPVTTFEDISKNVSRVGFQKNGTWMYTGGEDCTARIWDPRAAPRTRCQKIFQVQAPVNAVMLHPDQSQIMVGDQSGIIHIWDLKTDQNEQLIPEAEASIQDIAIDPAGKMMAAVNNKGNCYVWSLSGQPPHPVPKKHITAHSKYALRCKFSPDSTMLVTTSGDCSAKIWRTSDWALLRELRRDTQRWVWDAAFTLDSRFLFTGSSDSYARLWNIERGTLEREYCGHQKAITALAFKDQPV
ncbi:target of rapamycin complex subunit lst8 isoform X3 [Bombyx mori]|uniref:Target of rapamycin complex subunit lst8 n=1 Tax=Bombyx mori TaxID=7091 RepID=A0A8R2C904_BOMMO|nr:target of rapamycin complex subunit lst8 isoform X1 [Bombyx mori]